MPERLRLWLERGASGFYLRDAATGERVAWEDPRIRVVAAAGVSYRPEVLPDPSFDPPRRLALVPEPSNEHDPNAVAIWNEDGRCRSATSLRPSRPSWPATSRRSRSGGSRAGCAC